MNWFYVSMAACFFVGGFGHVLFAFWMLPILKYKALKRKIAVDISVYAESLVTGGSVKIDTIRCHGKMLSEADQRSLPAWYRMLIGKRGESPAQAAAVLATLANTSKRSHAEASAEKIRTLLNLV
jgi:hypothetical protein